MIKRKYSERTEKGQLWQHQKTYFQAVSAADWVMS